MRRWQLPASWLSTSGTRASRRDLPQLALLALMGFVINQLLEYGGLALSTAADVALLITSESIFTALLACWLLKEPFKRATGIALLLGSLGMYLIVEQSLLPHVPAGGGAVRILGDLLVIAGLISESYYTVRGKALLTKYPPFLIITVAMLGSLVFWVPVASWQVISSGWHPLTLPAWLALIWLAVMATALAYLTWFQGLTRIEGSKAASTLFLQPLVGTILAVVLLHEHLTVMTLVGGVLIAASVYLISR
ncbi:MAG TPA: EamA family transporter [Ktedonobacteraceae bacterium]|nr:EamA family transporter [Ktedonobacteraceae bacterium]